MELQSAIVLEVKKDERVYRLYIPNGAPFGEAYDAASEMVGTLFQLSKENHEKVQKEHADAKKEQVEDAGKKVDKKADQ